MAQSEPSFLTDGSESDWPLDDWAGRAAPSPVRLDGRTVSIVAYDPAVLPEALWQACGGSAINARLQHFAGGPFDGPGQIRSWLDRFNSRSPEAGGWLTHGIAARSTGALVGMASYMRIDPSNGAIEIGSILHAPAMMRSTMATEAQALLARHAFETLGYRRYEWKCSNANAASKRAAARLGFRFEGVFRQHMVLKGRNRDTAWFSIIDREWPLIRRAFDIWLDPANHASDGRQKRRLEDIREEIARGGTT